MVSEGRRYYIKVERCIVLILVLVEDGLGVLLKPTSTVTAIKVLILVLVEDGLGAHS